MVAGVLVAVAFSTHVGFTWWSLGVTIAAALTLGHLLRLGDHILEVPISAMLVLSLDGHTATGRVVETLLGAAVGLLAGLVASPVHVQPAGEAVQDLARQMAALLDRMADELTTQVPLQTTTDWLTQARRLGQEIHRVDRALTQAEESLRLNPRGLRLPHASLALRSGLDTLEHAAGIIRVLTRSFTERAAQLGENEPMYPPQAGEHLTRALRELAAAVRAYGKVVPAELGQEPEPADRELEHHLTAARQARERLTELLRSDPAIPPTDWLLHCEVLVHLNQLFDELCLQRRTQTRQHYHRRRHPTTPIRLTHKLRRPRPPHRPTPHPAHSGTH
ncbi:FUSC family protein [Carbonactinospora thermoautotrophica]|uniref:FUSC family protein n=1 Tax=Carbonactinospora thermoautotrophica TaxID=1469144 RepID=UPI003DA90AC9